MLLFTVSDEANIGDLKQEIYGKTKIKPERQKIIGIKAKDDDIVQEMVYLVWLILYECSALGI